MTYLNKNSFPLKCVLLCFKKNYTDFKLKLHTLMKYYINSSIKWNVPWKDFQYISNIKYHTLACLFIFKMVIKKITCLDKLKNMYTLESIHISETVNINTDVDTAFPLISQNRTLKGSESSN